MAQQQATAWLDCSEQASWAVFGEGGWRYQTFFWGAKTGHAGTLDPLACGVLPIAIGEATKTISYVVTAEKSYQFTLRWGAETQTDDSEGEITRTSDYCPSVDEIRPYSSV